GRRAENDLALMYLQAPDPAALSQASNRIDYLLRHAPESVGADCGDHRELTISPLAVSYTVSADDRLVTVYHVAYVP
ncbi:MAG TPA: hypothetical protein VFA26_19165, partial [Gemmataceae bacterium]|nr:hypothetical protein [Gemmataceae bacterium]